MKDMKYLIIVAVITLVLVLGCIDNTSPKSGTNKTSADDDMVFLSWKLEVSDILKDDLISAVNAIQNREDIAIKGKILKEDSQKYLDKLNKLNVSSKYKPSYSEYKKAIEDYHQAGEYMESETIESIGMALSNIDQGSNHLGVGNSLSPKSNMGEIPNTQAQITSQPTMIQTTSQPTMIQTTSKVLVQYNATRFDKLTKYILSYGPEYQYPNSGMTFLVINLKITNKGYQMIKLNEFQWNLKVNTKDNPNSYIQVDKIFYGKEDGIECRETELENDGWALCKIPFEVPENYGQYKIYWDSDVNTEWIFVPEQ